MSGLDFRTEFLYRLPAAVLCEFCRVMDGLPDPEWNRFASEVLSDQTDVRLAERRERRTDWVMNQWQSRNGRVGELLDLLERLQLLRPRDVILSCSSSLKSLPPPPPPLPPPVSLSLFDPPPKPIVTPPLHTYTVNDPGGREGVRPLPKPGPPPPSLDTGKQQAPVASSGVMCWSYEEVHAGTEGFSPALQVGEGGFGTVYRACMSNTVFAVKRLKEDSPLDWSVVKQSFRTEVEKLSQFRHPNIVELLGFSEAGGCFCIIYSFMENKSLEDQLHTVDGLSWQQRVGVVEGASRALQFLHRPPRPHSTLIHGDVKSSNILLDQHLEAKLADFGLARFGRAPGGRLATQTASVGQTATVRGTLAYLPEEYVNNGELGPAVDVYSFGVVLLEVLTGRRALEMDKSKPIYLKDLVLDQDSVDWRNHVDSRLSSGGAAEPAGCMEVAALACRCLNKRRKKRPAMTEVFDTLRDVHNLMKKSSYSSACGTSLPPPHLPQPPQAFPRPPQSLQSSVEALPEQMSRLGPLEDTYQSSSSSSSSSLSLFSSSSSSSSSSLTPPHPLHSSSSLPPISSLPIPPSSCSLSFAGPCESDESQGFSQYLAPSQLCGAAGNQYRRPGRSNGTHHHSVTPSNTHQYSPPSQPVESHYSPPSAPSGHFPPRHPDWSGAPPAGRVWTGSLSKPQCGITPDPDTVGRARAEEHPGARMGCAAGSDRGNHAGTCPGSWVGPSGILEGPSPAESLRSSSPELPVHINPCKQRFLVKKTLYEEGRIRTPELLSSDDLYADSSADSRGPEESDELDYLPAQPTAD